MQIKKRSLVLIIISLVLISSLLILYKLGFIFNKYYYASDFNINVIISEIDYNNNGIDDFSDILNGAKKEAYSKVKYKSAYYAGGYPPENEGVCTDLVWRAIDEAGYSLKDLVDEDIKNNPVNYPNITIADPNIDFRRVLNLKYYFENNALVLTNDLYQIDQFMPGDIVVFGDKHIGIISDKRNKKGISYLLHNAGGIQFRKEEDVLVKLDKKMGITGHYRFILK